MPLARHFLDKHNRRNNAYYSFSNEIEKGLKNYGWLGNARELRNFIPRLVTFSDNHIIGIDAFKKSLRLDWIIESPSKSMEPDDETLENRIERIEEEYIRKILQRTNGNKSETARLLNISRNTLDRKIAKYKIA
ncbi:helix-turn-helix domain-containing protein, partial [Planctomycetota bacterium]